MLATTANDDSGCDLFEQIGSAWPRRFVGFVFGEIACSSELRRSRRLPAKRDLSASVTSILPRRSMRLTREITLPS